MPGDPLTQSHQGWFWERALPGPSGQPAAVPDSLLGLRTGSQQQVPLLAPVSIGTDMPGMDSWGSVTHTGCFSSGPFMYLLLPPFLYPGLSWKDLGKCPSIKELQDFPNSLNCGAPRVWDKTLLRAFLTHLSIPYLPPLNNIQQCAQFSFLTEATSLAESIERWANPENPSGPCSEKAPNHTGQLLTPIIQENPLIKCLSAPWFPVPCRSNCTLPLHFPANPVLCISHYSTEASKQRAFLGLQSQHDDGSTRDNWEWAHELLPCSQGSFPQPSDLLCPCLRSHLRGMFFDAVPGSGYCLWTLVCHCRTSCHYEAGSQPP